MSPDRALSAARVLAFGRVLRGCFALIAPDAERVLPADAYGRHRDAIAGAIRATVEVESALERMVRAYVRQRR